MSAFQVYHYEHQEFGPIVLLLDDQDPAPAPQTKPSEELPPRRRGLSQRAGPLDKKSMERPPKSLDRRKSIENGITLPLITRKVK